MTKQSPNFTGQAFTKAESLNAATKLPSDEDERAEWQSANKVWWATNPTRYDWRQPVEHEKHTHPYFEEIDERAS